MCSEIFTYQAQICFFSFRILYMRSNFTLLSSIDLSIFGLWRPAARYDVKTPAMFTVRTAGKTPVSKSQGLKLSTDGLKGRVRFFTEQA